MSVVSHRVQHRDGASQEKKKPADGEKKKQAGKRREAKKHKPVADLYCYHAQNVPKFTALSESSPEVKHIFVGYELDPNFSFSKSADGSWEGRTWNPLRWIKRLDDKDGAARAWKARREFSSKDVLKWLHAQATGSINRINVDMFLPPDDVVRECMRVLEPGGAIEVVSSEKNRVDDERRMAQMQLNWRPAELSALDLVSNSTASDHYISEFQPDDAPTKFVIEKPGGDEKVDRRSFWERLGFEEQMSYTSRADASMIMEIRERYGRRYGNGHDDPVLRAFQTPYLRQIYRNITKLDPEDAGKLRGVVEELGKTNLILPVHKPLIDKLLFVARRRI